MTGPEDQEFPEDSIHYECGKEIHRLEADNKRLRGGLRKLQFAPDENSCEVHEPTDEDDEHNRSCCGCGAYQCLGCKSDCWLAELLKDSE
jgi:hypothetical protein